MKLEPKESWELYARWLEYREQKIVMGLLSLKDESSGESFYVINDFLNKIKQL
jgi:hypothetical protein